jgi:hypothetical protein
VAFHQYIALNSEIDSLNLSDEEDIWSYILGSPEFLVKKAYLAISGHSQVHLIFKWLWASKCQPKNKVFFWLLLQDKLNIRDRLRRRDMELESYTCENCILQRNETIYHLFLRCNFVKNC